MVIQPNNEKILEFIKAWGINIDHAKSVDIHIAVGDIVTVTVVYFPSITDEEKLMEEIKHYRLEEISDEYEDTPQDIAFEKEINEKN